jgi:hypothetical protein
MEGSAAVPAAKVATPREGVTKVGLVAKTLAPDPVSSVRAPANWAEVNDPNEVAFPTDVTAPVKLALVVTVPAVRPAAVPVMFVPTNAEGVPNAGVTRVGLFDSTTFVVPVDVVTPVPPFVTASVPATVTAPVVAVAGVSPVVPNEIELTLVPTAKEFQVPLYPSNKLVVVLYRKLPNEDVPR